MDSAQVDREAVSFGGFQTERGQGQSGTHLVSPNTSMRGSIPSHPLPFPSQGTDIGMFRTGGQLINSQIQKCADFSRKSVNEQRKLIKNLEQENVDLREEVSSLNTDYENLTTDYNILKSGYGTLSTDYDTLDSKYSALLDNFEQQKAKRQELQTQFNRVVSTLRNKRAEVDTLTQQIADKDKQIEDLRNLSQETLDAKQEEIDRLEENIRSLRNQRGEDEDTIQDLEQQLAQAREYHQYLSDKLNEVDFLARDLTDDVRRLEEEKQDLVARLGAANEENERLSQELAATRQQLEQTEADLQQTSEQLQQLYNSFNNIETADKQEAIAYLKGLSKLIQDGQFPADGVNIRSTSGLWRGVLSSLADIQGEINDLELEFAKDQGPDYCVNQIINELTQPEIVDSEGSLARINMLAVAYFSVPDQPSIGEAIVKAAVQRSIPDDSTYQALCESFGREEAQKMAVSVLNDQSIAELCQEANVCSEQGAPAEAAAKLRDILMRNIPEAISECFVKAARQKEEQLKNDKEQQIVAWGRQAIECLKNGQDDEFDRICNEISEAKGGEIFYIDFFINLEADEIEKQVKEFRESYRIKQPDGSVIQEEETFFDELDEAVQAMRNFEYNAEDFDQTRVNLFKSFEPVLKVLAQRAYTAGETVFLRDARTLFDSILARSESFVEKESFWGSVKNEDESERQGAFYFASKILPNIDKFPVNDGKFVVPVVVPVEEEGEGGESVEEKMMSIDDVLPDHLNMFDRLQKTVGNYAFQVGNNLLPQYQGTFEEFLSSYVLKNSRPESIAGMMRLPVVCGSYNYALGAPAELLDTVSNVESAAESLRKAYLLSFIINNDGSEVDAQGNPIVEVYNKIIEIADAAKSPDQYESLLQQAAEEGFDFGELSLEEAKDMCRKYAMSRDFIEAYQSLNGSYSDAVNFVFDRYGVIPPFGYPYRDLGALGLNLNLVGAVSGSSVSEQASQKAEQWKQGQFDQMEVTDEAYQAAMAIKEAVNVTNTNFWHQVGDSLIDIGREFCKALRNGEAPEEDIDSIRDYFYVLIRECEANGNVGIIPQTLPF